MARIWLAILSAVLAVAGAPSASSAPARFSLPGCITADTPQRPEVFTLQGCMQAGMWLDDMSWTGWGAEGADGTGSLDINTCRYSCADPRSRMRVPVVVHAFDPQPASEKRCPVGMQIYRHLTLALPGDHLPGVTLDGEYQGMPAAQLTAPASNPNEWGYVMCL